MHTVGKIHIQKPARPKHNFSARCLAPEAMAYGINLDVTFRIDNLYPNGASIDFTDKPVPNKLGAGYI